MKKYKYLLYGLYISLIFTNCSSVKSYRNFNYFNGVDYYNDSLKISGSFFGDIIFVDNIDRAIINKDDIKPYKQKDLLVYGKSEDEYAVFLFLGKQKKRDSRKTFLISNDKLHQRVIYEKEGVDNKLILLLKSIGQKKSNRTILRDGNTIINSMKFDSSKKRELSYMSILNTYTNENNFLHVLSKLDNAPIKETKKSRWEKLQVISTLLSNDASSGRYKILLNGFEKKIKKRQQKHVDSVLQRGFGAPGLEAIEKISKLSKETKILMLNENHWKPNHRIMAQKLLKPLKDNGYTYLAVEAVDKGGEKTLNSRKYPTKNTGYYTRESYFGLFLREALKLNYKIISYDDFDTNNREQKQAENIKAILDNDATAKIFVYAGFDHILEHNPSKKRMAEYVKELTGINPVTIDQAEIIADTQENISLVKSEYFQQARKINTNVDYFLINNIVPKLNLHFKASKLSDISIEDETLSNYLHRKVLVSVYYKDEYENHKSNSVPLINKIVDIQGSSIVLNLPTLELVVKIMDENNNLILLKNIESR
jgi:hypothetical protein